METKYPILRRPRRKLCFLAKKEGPPEPWTAPLTVGDIDKMFDDFDSTSNNNGCLSPPSLLRTFEIETEQHEKEPSPIPDTGQPLGTEGDVLNPAKRSPSPVSKLDSELDIPFKVHGPVKTSSPIEEKGVVEHVEESRSEEHQVVSPLLFGSGDEGNEKAEAETETEAQPVQEPECNGHVTQESGSSELDSPPRTVTLSKPQMSSCKNKVEKPCKESRTVNKTPQKPQKSVSKGKQKTPRQENADPPVQAVRQASEISAPLETLENVPRQPSEESARAGKDMTAFLKKLRDAGQPKPTCSRKSLSPVKGPTLPHEPEDNFLILEDDSSLWFSIPSKTPTSRKQKQSKSSSTDKDSSADKGNKDSLPETAQKQQESESKLESQTVTKNTKKTRGKAKKKEVTESGNDMDQLSSPEDLPAGDFLEKGKPNKKKQRLKKAPSKKSDTEEEKLQDRASREADEEIRKPEKNAQKSSDMQRSKTLKDGNKNAKTGRAKSLKGGRKVAQGAHAVKDTIAEETEKELIQSREEQADAEDVSSQSDKQLESSEAQTESEDNQTVGKRKRRAPGEWWVYHQTTEETKVADQPTVKKSKQSKKEPRAASATSSVIAKKDRTAAPSPVKAKKDRTAAPSPVKAKKDSILKKTNKTQPTPTPRKSTNKAKEKKSRPNKNVNTRGDTPDKVSHMTHIEHAEELQQEVLDQELDPLSSPLDLSNRDHSYNSGAPVFQRIYSHAPNAKLSGTPAPASARGLREQLTAAEPGRRRRKPPGSWWTVNKDVESDSSQQQHQELKPSKERKKQSKQSRSPRLGTPKNGNMAVPPKPRSGAPVPPLKLKPPSPPKTVKRSLAIFRDIFSSVTETPAAVSSRDNVRRKFIAPPAEEVSVPDSAAMSQTDEHVLSMDTADPRSSQDTFPNHETQQDSTHQDRLNLFSGPASMIERQQYEEDEDLMVPPTRSPAALSVSDLCAPPLEPLVLEPEDKANLRDWLNTVWLPTADRRAEITPELFDWFSYQGRAIGFQLDLDCGSFCSGKILLGSYMKKPLWVDHSATTVFNLLTSSVRVNIDSKESRFNPGQSFLVQCGHAYSIQNTTSKPAALYFTRMSAESTD